MYRIAMLPVKCETHIARMNNLKRFLEYYSIKVNARNVVTQYATDCALHKFHKNKQLRVSLRYGRKIIDALTKIEGDYNE